MKIFKRNPQARAERQAARQEKKAERQEARQERRADRQEARQNRRAGRQEARQERRAQRQEARQDRKTQRQEARAERREARREARAERRGQSEEPLLIITDEQLTSANAGAESASSDLASCCGEGSGTATQVSPMVVAEPQVKLENSPYTVSSSSDGADAAGFASAEEALEMFENDEKAFFAKLNGMGSQERAGWLMTVQTELQATNQLTTAITNFQKAEHDTQKAVLANIRV